MTNRLVYNLISMTCVVGAGWLLATAPDWRTAVSLLVGAIAAAARALALTSPSCRV